jgi:hypothetical protein
VLRRFDPSRRTNAFAGASKVARYRSASVAGCRSDTRLPFGGLVADYGLRSFQALHDWALRASNRVDPHIPEVATRGGRE